MTQNVILVAYQDQDNLGVGYLASVIQKAGFHPVMVDYRLGQDRILEIARERRPLAIGFSIIFQFQTSEFQYLMKHLRANSVDCHFTAGGHYPSLRWREVLQRVPELDSIVRFEGEWTFLDLITRLRDGGDWRDVKGVCYRSGEEPVSAELRPLETELDSFPAPLRPPPTRKILEKTEVTLIASRGCLYNCSFCSIRQFYSPPLGPLKRLRCPEMVVREMQLLHEQYQAEVFLFQDDDFPGTAKHGGEWAFKFAEQLRTAGLGGRVLWKINCRADEVEEQRFEMLRDVGLLNVYLGIESGTIEGLTLMNKHTVPETNLRASEILRKLELQGDFGFMIFDPQSSLDSVARNLDFLEELCGDGFMAVTGCKMIPYAETAIESWLAQRQRLEVHGEYENYHFLSADVETLYAWFVDTFGRWIESPKGVLPRSRRAKYSLGVHRRLGEPSEKTNRLDKNVTEIVSAANRLFIDGMRRAIEVLSAKYDTQQETGYLAWLQSEIGGRERRICDEIEGYIGQIEELAAATSAFTVA